MKAIVFFLSILFSVISSQAQMSEAQELEAIQNIAKNERRQLWRSGYKEVSSQVTKMTLEELNKEVANNSEVETPLKKEEISALYKCHHSKTCSLYLISIWSEMYGGSGSTYVWVLFYPKSGKHFSIKQVVYAE